MKKVLLVLVLCFATLLCSCKSRDDVRVLSVNANLGTTRYTFVGEKCLDGLNYESANLNVAVVKIEDNTLHTCISTYHPKINKEMPEITTYVFAQNVKFYTRDSKIINHLEGDIENKVVYEELTEKAFIKKFKKRENPKMYLWLNDAGEVEIAMMYLTTATKKQ